MEGHPIPRAARRRGQEGFTLVELMIASMVFAIGMVAVLGSVVAIMNSHRITALKHRTYVELQNQHEAVKATIANAGLQAAVGTYALPNIANSTFSANVANPNDPSDLYSLPVSATDIADVFGGVDPSPMEVIYIAEVESAPDTNLFYKFRMSALFP